MIQFFNLVLSLTREGEREEEKERDLSLHAESGEKVVIQTQGVGGECAEAAETDRRVVSIWRGGVGW